MSNSVRPGAPGFFPSGKDGCVWKSSPLLKRGGVSSSLWRRLLCRGGGCQKSGFSNFAPKRATSSFPQKWRDREICKRWGIAKKNLSRPPYFAPIPKLFLLLWEKIVFWQSSVWLLATHVQWMCMQSSFPDKGGISPLPPPPPHSLRRRETNGFPTFFYRSKKSCRGEREKKCRIRCGGRGGGAGGDDNLFSRGKLAAKKKRKHVYWVIQQAWPFFQTTIKPQIIFLKYTV